MLPFPPPSAPDALPPWADVDHPDYDPLRTEFAYPELFARYIGESVAPPPKGPRPLVLSTKQMAGLLGLSIGTVRRWIKAGTLKAVKAGDAEQARWSVPVSEVERVVGRRVDLREEFT